LETQKMRSAKEALRMPVQEETAEIAGASDRASARDELDQEHYNSGHEQKVNVPADHMETDPSDQPKDQQNYEDRPQHCLCRSYPAGSSLVT
jgi:hypothetical protein